MNTIFKTFVVLVVLFASFALISAGVVLTALHYFINLIGDWLQ